MRFSLDQLASFKELLVQNSYRHGNSCASVFRQIAPSYRGSYFSMVWLFPYIPTWLWVYAGVSSHLETRCAVCVDSMRASTAANRIGPTVGRAVEEVLQSKQGGFFINQEPIIVYARLLILDE